jgi:enoyl-CoA hydratase
MSGPLQPATNREKLSEEFLLTGDLLNASEAERIGLVNRVVPSGQAYAAGLALAKRLAAGPTRAIRWTKLALNKRRSYWIPGSYAPPWSEKRTPD